MTGGWSASAAKCIERSRRNTKTWFGVRIDAEGRGTDSQRTGMAVRRLTDEEMFLELKRA